MEDIELCYLIALSSLYYYTYTQERSLLEIKKGIWLHRKSPNRQKVAQESVLLKRGKEVHSEQKKVGFYKSTKLLE